MIVPYRLTKEFTLVTNLIHVVFVKRHSEQSPQQYVMKKFTQVKSHIIVSCVIKILPNRRFYTNLKKYLFMQILRKDLQSKVNSNRS